ncbi:carboxypeptidase regulatory-like domain-containing protein [bacterium]|nr:carboxypeptidase regulatory-like domain-containing protein [bacterium]
MSARATVGTCLFALALGGLAVAFLVRDDSPSKDPRGRRTTNRTRDNRTNASNPGSATVLVPTPGSSSSSPTPSSSSPSSSPSNPGDPAPSTANGSATPHEARVRPPARPGRGGGPVVLVLGPDGQPVEGAVVEARTQTRQLTARPSNKLGEAALDPVGDEGTIVGTARHARFAQPASFSGKRGDARIVARFSVGAWGILAGMIHDIHGAAPAKAILEVVDEDGFETEVSSDSFTEWDGDTNRTGVFRVALAPGKYTVSSSAAGFVPSDKAYTTIVASKESIVDLLVEKGSDVSGKVALPPDLLSSREPIVLRFELESVRGTVDNPTTFSREIDQELGADASFKLEGMRWGQCRLRVRDATRVGAWAILRLEEGVNAEGVGLALEAMFTSVRGIVRDEAGKAIPSATVRSQRVEVKTDATGVFELRGLDTGNQDVTAEKPGFERGFVSVGVRPPGQAPPDVVLTLYARGSATGRVLVRGQGAPGVKVVVVQKIHGGGMKTWGPVLTGKNGAWAIPELDRGSYFVKVGAGDPFDDAGAPTFEVLPGEKTTAPDVEIR